MKLAVLGANGREGSLILKEAINRGIDTTAIVRHTNRIPEGTPTIMKSVYDLTADDIAPFDVIVSALGFWGDDVVEFPKSTKYLAKILNGQKAKLLVVGGAGTLYTDDSRKLTLNQAPGFPEAIKPLSENMGKELDLLKESSGFDWVYISPAQTFDADGAKTGEYKFGGDVLPVNSEGKSYISYPDYALGMVDEVQNLKHLNQHISLYHD